MRDPNGDDVPELLARTLAAMPAVLCLFDVDGRFLWVNRTVPPLTLEDVIGRSMYDFLDPADHAVAQDTFTRVIDTGQPDRYTGHGPGARGPRSRYENWLAPVLDGDRVVAIAVVTRDVSAEWELYDTLRDREQRLSLALEAAGMGTWRFDLTARVVELDEPARAIYGVPHGRLDSRTFTTTHIHADDRAEADRVALASMQARRPYAAENRIVRSDGTVRWVAITGSPVADEHGVLVAMLGTVTDITERREREARAREAQKLEAVGQLTSGIAHNFNNLLAAILPALGMIQRDVGPRTAPWVHTAIQATERAAQLVRDLMTFAGRHPRPSRTREAPEVLIERTMRLCRPTFDRRIRLGVEITPGLPEVVVDAGQIEQALLNILINARDAVLETGRDEHLVTVRALPHPDGVAIVVEDDGPGMPDDVRERVFDPFFTTKEVGRGTGLGLSTAYAIVREHGGRLVCDSAPGAGTRFTMVLPVAPAPASPGR